MLVPVLPRDPPELLRFAVLRPPPEREDVEREDEPEPDELERDEPARPPAELERAELERDVLERDELEREVLERDAPERVPEAAFASCFWAWSNSRWSALASLLLSRRALETNPRRSL